MSLAVLRIAGRRLADDLSGQADPRSLVLAIPRRGAVVARQVALRLRLHVDVLPVTPIVVAGPSGVEATAGALAMWGTPVLDDDLRRHLEVDDDGVATALALA
ncbi:MAG: hypothetical protein KC464_13390, partial [Myxococcales bacterium]|nr:hypothetical protein [Myxococcales bacterium]